MNFILHQFKTDLRHFRWRLVVLWLSFAAGPILNSHHALPGNGLGALGFFLNLWQACFAVAIVTALVQADPLTGDTAAWLCRPLRRRHLFWAKSAFFILFLLIPWLATKSLDWSLRGYSWELGWLAAEESRLYAVTVVLISAVLAALTTGVTRFFLAVAIATGGIFAWVVVVEILVHMGLMHQIHTDWRNELQLQHSAAAVAWLVSVAGAFVAWLWQGRAGRRRTAMLWLAIGLLPFPIITTVWSKNFLTPKLTPSAPVTLSMPGTNRPPDEAGGQWLSSEFFVSGVPAGQFAVIQNAPAKALFPGTVKPMSVPLVSRIFSQGRTRPINSTAQDEYYGVIRDFFPSNVVWFNDNYSGGLGGTFDVGRLSKQFHHEPSPATLTGHLTVDLFDIKKVADLPLDYASAVAFPGLRVTLQKVTLADGAIDLELDESFAQIAFNRKVDNDTGDNSSPFCTYVLYHPGSGEAFVVNQRNWRQYFPALLNLESHAAVRLHFPYPALRERLAGVTAADWLRQARLYVFAPIYAGTSDLAFRKDDYQWSGSYGVNIAWQNENFTDAQAIDQASLPANFTDRLLDVYLDQILLNIPQSLNSQKRDAVRKKLEAIGTNGLPALLRRLPLDQFTETSLVIPVINKLVTRDQLPELRAALQRDDLLVNVFVKKKWEADARDILIARLPDHRQPLLSAALLIAAEVKDPATYADLRWHFVHMSDGHDKVLPALEQCPGFDTTAAVSEAWQNARLGLIHTDNIAPLAARQGLPDALNIAIVNAQQTQVYGESEQRHQLSQLAALTGYMGDTNNILSWVVDNRERLHYDFAQQHYLLQ